MVEIRSRRAFARVKPLPPVLVIAFVVLFGGSVRGDPATSASLRAYEAWRSGQLQDALSWSAAAVTEAEADSYAWTLHGYLLSRAGRKAEAAAAYERAGGLDPSDARAQNNLGAVLLQLGRVEEARGPLERALTLQPHYADAHNNLGALHERKGRVGEAVAAYQRAARANPEHVHAYNNLGALELRRGRVAEARRALERARDLAPHSAVPTLNLLLLGGRDLAEGDLFDRLQVAARAPGASPRLRARALAALAGRATQERRFEEARRLYLRALVLQPRDPRLLNNVAVTEDQLGLDREAMLHLQAALELDPDLLVVRNNVGIVQAHRGDLGLAEDTYRSLLRLDPRFHRAYYNLGVILAARGRLPDSREAFLRARRLAPRDADIRYNLGLVERRLGGSADAEIRAYREALALDPAMREAHLALGCLLADPQTRLDLRDEPAARRHLERFLELALPTDDEGRAEARNWLEWLGA